MGYLLGVLTVFTMIKVEQFKILGFTYLAFQNFGFLYSITHKDADKDLSFIDFFAISAFFPIIMAGPISSLADIRKQLAVPTVNIPRQDLIWGGLRILNGFFKKSLIDFIMISHFVGFTSQTLNFPITILNFSLVLLYLYFDFSASSDLAIGSAKSIGVKLQENFRSPYTSYSLAEFWRRWHISLGSWFQNYFLIPVQIAVLRRFRIPQSRLWMFNYSMVVLTFIMIGLVHGLGLRFIFWGLLNGFFVALSHSLDSFCKRSQLSMFLSWVVTMLIVFLGQYILLTPSALAFQFGTNSVQEVQLALGYLILLALVHLYDRILLETMAQRWIFLFWGGSIFQIIVIIIFCNPKFSFMYSLL